MSKGAKQHNVLDQLHTKWSNYLHRRTMRLLLQYDQTLFHNQFHIFYAQSSRPIIPLLQFYDRYLRLVLLSDELLDDLMPRIRRQLSLKTSQVNLQEEAPTRGSIDWQQTIAHSVNELPGTSPLSFRTTFRLQSMSTPENIFMVAVLLQYQLAIRDTLRDDTATEVLTSEERQQLTQIGDRVDQELANISIYGFLNEARQADVGQLAEQVQTQSHTGMAPYLDLVTWWEKAQHLHIGGSSGLRHLTLLSKRHNLEDDSWLYELWIALELCNFLYKTPDIQIDEVKIECDHILCRFCWQGQPFVFHYQRRETAAGEASHGWQHIPASSSPFRFEREKPLRIQSSERLIWQEPPFPISYAYASPSNSETSHRMALTRLLGEMQVLGAHTGILFTPVLPGDTQDHHCDIKPDAQVYLEPGSTDCMIRAHKLTPDINEKELQTLLTTILPTVWQDLSKRETPACHGIWLDPDNINASQDRLVPGNILCPKPHIGKDVFDLVDHATHCLKDPRLCHVIGQMIIPPFAIRMATLDSITQQGENLRKQSDAKLRDAEETNNEAYAETLRSNIFISIGRTVEEYVKVRGNTVAQEEKLENWVFGKYWKDDPHCLSEEARAMLLSATYIWEEYKQTTLKDWAAPAIQYCRALENEIHRRLRLPSSDRSPGFKLPGRRMTLGALETIYNTKNRATTQDQAENRKIQIAKENWSVCTRIVTNAKIADFEAMLRRLSSENVTRYRNQTAHDGAVSQQVAQSLQNSIIGNRDHPGILLWMVENLPPVV